MTRPFELNSTFGSLFAVTVVGAILTGSTIQWTVHEGLLKRGIQEEKNRYNVVVAIAAVTSLIQTVTCFVNALMAPDTSLGFMIYIVFNWVFMTHSSVMVVSLKLSMTYRNPRAVWSRLLWINYVMFPISVFTCVYWPVAWNSSSSALNRANAVVEPIQIALWGFFEFCLSGAFIVKMWRYHWTKVERWGIFVLVLVGVCDMATVLLNIFLGDLESTCIKGFVYCLRIRLEVSILSTMADYLKSKLGRVSFGLGASSRLGLSSNIGSLSAHTSASNVKSLNRKDTDTVRFDTVERNTPPCHNDSTGFADSGPSPLALCKARTGGGRSCSTANNDNNHSRSVQFCFENEVAADLRGEEEGDTTKAAG